MEERTGKRIVAGAPLVWGLIWLWLLAGALTSTAFAAGNAGGGFVEVEKPPPLSKGVSGGGSGWQSVIDSGDGFAQPASQPPPAPPRPPAAAPPAAPPAPAKPSAPSPPSPAPQAQPAPPQAAAAPSPAPASTHRSDIETRRQALKLIDTLLDANLPAEMPPTLYINNMTKVQYAGAVSMAMEGMRLFYGDMDEQQEAHFESRWRPLFRYPGQEIVFYLNRLNPLLVEFLALRAALNDCIEDFNSAQFEVMGASSLGDAAAVAAAMDDAALYALVGKTLNARLQLVGKKIIALGEPPDAAGRMKKARQRHEAAFQALAPVGIVLEPAELKAVPGRKFSIRMALAGTRPGPDDKLSFRWSLDDGPAGWGKLKNGVFVLTHALRGKIGSKHTLKVALEQYPGPTIRARASARITLVRNPGCWVLKESHSYKKSSGPYLESRLDPSACRNENRLHPPTFAAGGGRQDFGYLYSWEKPPARLYPGTRLEIPVTISRLHACAGYSPEGLEKLADKARLNEGRPVVEYLKKLTDYNTVLSNCRYRNGAGGCSSFPAPGFGMAWYRSLKSSRQKEQSPYTRSSLDSTLLSLPAGEMRAEKKLILEVPAGIRDEYYDPHKDQRIFLHLQAASNFFYSKDYKYHNSGGCSDIFTGVVYSYAWDPTGSRLKPPAAGGTETAGPDREESGPEAEKAARIEFHRHNIEYFERSLAALKRQLGRAASPEVRNRLTRNLLYAEDARQREIDAITAIRTGSFVHTRTRLDAFNMKVMADESRQLAAQWHTLKRITERGPRLIALAPAAEQPALMEFFNRQIRDAPVGEGRPARYNRALKALGDKVMGGLEQERQAHADEAQYWDENLKMAEGTKTFADYSLMLLSFTGAGAAYNLFGQARLITASGVFMSYGAASGYLAGGVTEAVSRTLSAYNVATTVVDAGMRGYQEGVLRHLDEYARNPEKVKLDEEKAGFKGAAWSAGTAAAFAAAIHFGMNSWRNRQQLIRNREARLNLKCDLAIRKARVAHYQRRVRAAAGKVENFAKVHQALAEAGRAGAPKAKIMELRERLDAAYREIKTDWFAKMRMKALARQADFRTPEGRGPHRTVHAYNSVDRRFTRQLKNRVSERMEQQGFCPQKYKTFSNASSRGGVAADVDLGVIEPPRYVTVEGKRVPNPEHLRWRKSLTRTVGGQTVQVSPEDLQTEGQKQLEQAFRDLYGRDPGEAMLNFTTSYHSEAYRDPRWLGAKSSKTPLVYETDPAWTQQAADVTDFKINRMGKENPSLGYYATLQENCRGLVKDIDSKLMPLLKNSKNRVAVDHMKKLRETMDRFATNQIGPVEAERRLRLLTGNADGVIEISKRFAVLLEGLKKMPR